jgi:glycosyltransferase involved in cell wall biosynthesis
MESPRIAWLLTSGFYYWHPMLCQLTRLYPDTLALTAKWRGYAPGYEDTFKIEVVGERKIVALTKSETSYGSNFTYLPLGVVKSLLRFRPTVIFSNAFGLWTLLAILFKPLGRWKVVIAYEGSSPGVDYRNSPPRLALRRMMVQAADACISNSQAGKAYLIEYLNAKASEVFVQPYEVPAADSLEETAIPPAAIVQARKPIFLYVGSLIPRKGLQFLLDACAELQQQGIESYTLLIVGDGTQRQDLEQFCQQQNITDRVQWIGRVDYGDLGAFFKNADVFILPTLEDTWGVVVSEAMVLGTPVLCSLLAGAKELIQDDENGYCFNPQEAGKLATLMRRFIDDVSLADRLGQKAAQSMQAYSPEEAAKFLGTVATFVLDKSR